MSEGWDFVFCEFSCELVAKGKHGMVEGTDSIFSFLSN